MSDFERWTDWPAWAKDAVVSDTVLRFGWWDRLLILLGRPVFVTTKTWTGTVVGRTAGMTRSHVPGIRWPWSRPAFGVATGPSPANRGEAR